jgi:hypothetical protein
MNYFQSLYDAIPKSILHLEERLSQGNLQDQISINRIDTDNPLETGFDIVCDNITWHCSWNRASDFISISENGKKRPGINRINYGANRAAVKLVQDIHREKLQRMPDDSSDTVRWIEQQTGKLFKPIV